MINGHKYCPPLTRDIECDVLIVGGSSSGRSAGFLTPDSEFELHREVLSGRHAASARAGAERILIRAVIQE